MKVTVDIVLFGYEPSVKHAQTGDLRVLLIKRRYAPFAGGWALPGGFVQENESLGNAVARKLEEETGVHDVFTEQLYTFGDAGRDPREHTLSVAYYGLVQPHNYALTSSYELGAQWFSLSELPILAFDHAAIIQVALERLRGKLSYPPIGFEMLPEKFTLLEVQHLYEAVLGSPLQKSAFRKKMLSFDILERSGEFKPTNASRPAEYFSFNKKKYDSAQERGFYIKFEK